MKNIEVNIKQSNDSITATTPSFPDCVGTGKTEKAALSSLSTQISRYIAKQSKLAFKSLLQSQKYSNITIDSTQADTGYSRLYPLFRDHQTVLKMANIKLDLLDTINPNLLVVNRSEQSVDDYQSQRNFSLFVDGDSTNGCTFGFPISFN